MTGPIDEIVTLHRGDAPLILAFPHGGNDLAGLEECFVSPWAARRDADWHIASLYDFARSLDVTMIATRISRSVIDVNRSPDGASLYPGRVTTDLCPLTDFDGAPLYQASPPDGDEIARRRTLYFDPYHRCIAQEITRLRQMHPRLVLYDAHSIRSHIPRLFEGVLPRFNIGSVDGASCSPALSAAVADICAGSGHSWVLNGRFKGGWTTRHYGAPQQGVHAIQMELAMRAYLQEPAVPKPGQWPASLDRLRADATSASLERLITACLAFAADKSQ